MAFSSLNPLPRKTVSSIASTVGNVTAPVNQTTPRTYGFDANGVSLDPVQQQKYAAFNAVPQTQRGTTGTQDIWSPAPVSTAATYEPQVKPQTAYQKLLAQRLSGNDPNVINAQQQQNTDTAASRYLAMKTGNQQNLNAGFTPGSLQSQRGLDRTQATAEEGILQGQDRVNALTRDSSQQTLTAANEQDTQDYARGQTLINSIADPKARQAAQSLIANGTDPQQAYDTVIGSTGTVNDQYQSQTAAQTELQGYKDVYMAGHPGATEDDANAYAQGQLNEAHKATNQPNHGATVTQTLSDIQGKVNTGDTSRIDWNSQDTKDALGQAPVISPATISASGSPEQFVSDNAGKLVTAGGKPVVVQKYTAYRSGTDSNVGGQDYYHSIRIIQGTDATTGKPIYIDADTGKSSSTPPPAENDPTQNHAWVNSFT